TVLVSPGYKWNSGQCMRKLAELQSRSSWIQTWRLSNPAGLELAQNEREWGTSSHDKHGEKPRCCFDSVAQSPEAKLPPPAGLPQWRFQRERRMMESSPADLCQ
ncbi:hypothetical protein LTR60_004233, partial [Cryomyces antarcticus]